MNASLVKHVIGTPNNIKIQDLLGNIPGVKLFAEKDDRRTDEWEWVTYSKIFNEDMEVVRGFYQTMDVHLMVRRCLAPAPGLETACG
jgi:hypothetical protein